MKLTAGIAAFAAAVSAAREPRSIVETRADASSKIPTSYESAVMGRRILALSKLATLSTVFPDNSDASAAEHRPADLGGVPIGMMDYVADCEDEGNPTILAIKIATSFKNVKAGSNMTLSMRWTPPYPPSRRMSFFSRLTSFFHGDKSPYELMEQDDDAAATAPDTVPYSAANLPRFSLIGHLEPINPDTVQSLRLATCFVSKHRDAKYWLPGNRIHEAEWARLVVTHVYWVGGFGDRAYIGWIPVEEWQSVTKTEWTSITLPGEKKGWSEWALDGSAEL